MQYYDPRDNSPAAATGPSAEPTPTASAPPTAPPPQNPTISVGGYTPDYNNLITNDPAYQAAKAAADQAQANAGSMRKQQLRDALIRYGGLPSGFTDTYGDLDQATKDAAAANQNSTLAQLAANYGKSQEQFRRSLAARGALQSGDLNYGQDQLDQAYGQQRYDAANAFGNEANQALAAYMGVLQGNANSLAGAIGQAEGNVSSNPAYTPTPSTTATYDAGVSGQAGQPVYSDGNGNYYTQDGNPFTPSAAPAASPYGGSTESSPYSWGWGGKV